ncbi:hypothetical protein Tco_0954513 [Tanacetum coccineum]|uniref:Uncharacterized protein n=1 Tax=Tanacetum coccineum TaxID=301880 RepID=A0ABQ5E4L0_9ASTR
MRMGPESGSRREDYVQKSPGEASINLNTTVGDNDDDDVQEIRSTTHNAGTKRKLLRKKRVQIFGIPAVVKRK